MPVIYTLLIAISLLSSGCDMSGRKECRWYLVPEKDNQASASDGYIAVCARNYVNNKQDCGMQAKLEFAKSVYNKKFKYTDLKFSESDTRFPRRVVNIERFCL